MLRDPDQHELFDWYARATSSAHGMRRDARHSRPARAREARASACTRRARPRLWLRRSVLHRGIRPVGAPNDSVPGSRDRACTVLGELGPHTAQQSGVSVRASVTHSVEMSAFARRQRVPRRALARAHAVRAVRRELGHERQVCRASITVTRARAAWRLHAGRTRQREPGIAPEISREVLVNVAKHAVVPVRRDEPRMQMAVTPGRNRTMADPERDACGHRARIELHQRVPACVRAHRSSLSVGVQHQIKTNLTELCAVTYYVTLDAGGICTQTGRRAVRASRGWASRGWGAGSGRSGGAAQRRSWGHGGMTMSRRTACHPARAASSLQPRLA